MNGFYDCVMFKERPMTDSAVRALVAAISRLRKGRELPVDLVAILINEGFDVPSLERAYGNG